MVRGGSTNTGASGMVVVVTRSALEERGAQESLDLLQFLGYVVHLSQGHALYEDLNPRYIIDARHPNWFGWKGAMSAITVWHYPQMQEWHRLNARNATADLTSEEESSILEGSSCKLSGG